MTIQYFSTKAAAEATGGQAAWVLGNTGTPWEARTDADILIDPRPAVPRNRLLCTLPTQLLVPYDSDDAANFTS